MRRCVGLEPRRSRWPGRANWYERALFGDDRFPTPEAVLKASPERLRSAGLSRPKASYVLGIAQKTVDGHIPTLDECERMTYAAIVERLTSIKGVGRWTAEMLLIFNLGRPDVLPAHDLGVRKGFQFAYGKRKLAAAGATRPLVSGGCGALRQHRSPGIRIRVADTLQAAAGIHFEGSRLAIRIRRPARSRCALMWRA